MKIQSIKCITCGMVHFDALNAWSNSSGCPWNKSIKDFCEPFGNCKIISDWICWANFRRLIISEMISLTVDGANERIHRVMIESSSALNIYKNDEII